MLKQCSALALVALAVAGCTTVRETQPTQTAREQLIMSSAADYASAQIHPNVPRGNAIFVDGSNFPSDAEYRSSYAVAAIQAQLLSDGYRLVGSADQADTIARLGSGALSINQSDTLFGIPSIPIPIPLTGTVQTPELALYKKARRTGVAKLLISFYNAKSGDLQDVVGPLYGFSHDNRASILGVSWRHQNIVPAADQAELGGRMPKPAPSTTPVGGDARSTR
ncbi:DUF6655 family protein [Salinisphaera sp. Q1T1-3]|uniref:DUF6655 family protein n=1 Tax=Salinisphaera sp. Q1T1-3 TaxID=2321229 RepID=UPI000E720A75|nr:DUF6655 family protein [Salinisphaera sp. Q1T1-3]RJS93082.1 hypothetical protein D3260_09285 [Salinisphaera sp. Q1T1-3]